MLNLCAPRAYVSVTGKGRVHGRRGGELDADCSHSLTAVFLVFRIGSVSLKGGKKGEIFPGRLKKF